MLNPEQLRAVQTTKGAVLLLAGAGSGKTRVITHRIANLLANGVSQSAILAVTFTNKAAREMAQRVRALYQRPLPRLTVCTFHSFGLRVLKEFGHELGYRKNFSIYDDSDRQACIKEAARDLGLLRREDKDGFDTVATANLFSRLKGDRAEWQTENETLQPLFAEYQHRLKLFNAVDFDDLISLPIELLLARPETLETLRERYRFLMVDEFQDTSAQQYRLVSLLADRFRNICVVGDDDQSIYSWRGANYDNIIRFEQDFPDLLEIKLEQNYRSTRNILEAANSLIAKNLRRKPKKLWSIIGRGEPILVSFPENETREAEIIATAIRATAREDDLDLGQYGVLVRANSMTRAIEEEFVRSGLPYQVSGGASFFGRREVKDIIAYLRVLANPDDDVSFLRIVNRPRRGIGSKTLEVVVATAKQKSCSLYSAASALQHAADSPLAEAAKSALADFISLAGNYRERFLGKKKMSIALRSLVETIDYWSYLLQENTRAKIARWKFGNVEGMIDSLAAYESDSDNIDPNLFDYLNRISLISRDDMEDSEQEQQKINLMTIHAAKGLEFEVVFVAGVERDLMPHARTIEENEANLEEERRLFYVAVTRAKRRLYLSACRARRRRGDLVESGPSPFLDDIPQELLAYQPEEQAVSEADGVRLFADLKKSVSD